MSAPAQVDYDALAQQHGAVSQPVDYDALAAQHGATPAASPSVSPATIGPRTGATAWLQDLESDIRNGTGSTFVGRALQKMGAEGTSSEVGQEVGDYVASPILGPVRLAKGTTELGSGQIKQGSKDIGAGALETVQIPAALAVGPGEEAAASALGKAGEASEEWQRINQVLGVSANQVRIGKGATELSDAATMPGRGVANAGLTAKELSKMTPVERMAAIAPHYQQAGAAIDAATKAASDAGKTLDVGNSAMGILKNIADPTLQDKAIQVFNSLARQLGIQDLRQATPEEALALRRALASGGRFMPSGDLNSLASVRAGLTRAVSSDLHDAVPSLKGLDQNYSDLRGAMDAAQRGVSRAAAKAPPNAVQRFMTQHPTASVPLKIAARHPFLTADVLGIPLGVYAERKLFGE